ncbi:MAG: hypothetical protein JNK78_04760 [Planctomycetes bacterium]|nr:hypothetical protein [Planctomycetota bacterium]
MDILNPRHVSLEDRTTAAIQAVASAREPLLEQLGKEVATTTREELVALKAAGQAVVLKSGESPFTKVGKDAVFTVTMGTGGEQVAASKSKMPRLLEVEGRLQAVGKDMFLDVARVLREHGVMDEKEAAAFTRVVQSWQP